jgi:hypothetical protein
VLDNARGAISTATKNFSPRSPCKRRSDLVTAQKRANQRQVIRVGAAARGPFGVVNDTCSSIAKRIRIARCEWNEDARHIRHAAARLLRRRASSSRVR